MSGRKSRSSALLSWNGCLWPPSGLDGWSKPMTKLIKEIRGILLRKEGQGTLKSTWCGGSWELSLRAWVSPRLAFGLRSEANWDLQTKAVCDLLL